MLLWLGSCAHAKGAPPEPEGQGNTREPIGGPAGNVELRGPELPIAVVATAQKKLCEDPRIRACRVYHPPGDLFPLGLASAHGSVALLYATLSEGQLGPQGRSSATLLLHDRSLRPHAERTIRTEGALSDVSLVDTADGWLVALGLEQSVELVRLRADGAEIGTRTTVDHAITPRLVADSPRPPLLTWSRTQDAAVWAQTIVERGAPQSPVKLFDTTVEANFDGGIAVAPGEFLIARRSGRGVEVRQLSAAGQLRSDHADVGRSTEYPMLVRCDDGPRMIWSEFGDGAEIRWARLRDDGAIDGDFVRLSGTPDHFNHSPAVCDGVDTLVLLAGYTGGTGLSKSLDLVRVDARGQIVTDAIDLHGDEGHYAYAPTMLRDADALFVAWAVRGEPARIAVARVDLARGGAMIRR